jgi:ABC-2 type transport system permease protein
MAVYKRSYKIYDGPRTPAGLRFTVLTRFSFRLLFQSRIFTAFVVLCMFPVLVAAGHIYFSHSQAAQMLLNIKMSGLTTIDNTWFAGFLTFQAWVGFMIVAAAAPGMVSRDFANQALQLYLSRPLSRTEYMLGKLSVLALLLSFTTWIPGLLLFLLQASQEGNGWIWHNFYLTGSILLSSLLWIVVVSLYALALSVWVRWRVAATALIVASSFLLPGFGQFFDFVLDSHWGRLLDLSFVMRVIWGDLYRLSPDVRAVMNLDEIPVWSAWAAVLALCGISLLLLNKKLKAREVVRG